jgi:hypothetical protein
MAGNWCNDLVGNGKFQRNTIIGLGLLCSGLPLLLSEGRDKKKKKLTDTGLYWFS